MNQSRTILFGALIIATGLPFYGMGGCSKSTSAPAPTSHIALVVTGNATGKVTTDKGGLSCANGDSGVCSGDIETGTTVTFTAVSDAGFLFNRWRGASCPPGPTCTLIVNADTNLEASFTRIFYKSKRALDGTNASQSGLIQNIWVTTTDGTDQSHFTAFTDADSDDPALCPDANKVAYSSNRNLADFADGASHNAVDNIWIGNADGSGGDISITKSTAAGAHSSNPQWTPDQSKILYLSRRSTTDIGNPASAASGGVNIWISNADGSGGDVPLTNFGSFAVQAGEFSLSPDGTQILFTSSLNLSKDPLDPANATTNIWRIGIDGSGLTALTQNTASGVNNQQPQLSPDGTRIAWTSRRNVTDDSAGATAATSYNVWIMDADGSNPIAVTHKDDLDTDSSTPLWSPDGSFLLFLSELNLTDITGPQNAANLWRSDPDGSGLTHLTDHLSAYILDPIWAPDGSLILFDSSLDFMNPSADVLNANGNANLFTVRPDGSSPTALTKIDFLQADSLTPFGSGS